jgi:methionyl-tRNA formyltransferase
LNITILANRDLASHLALNQLVPQLAATHRLRIFLSSKVGGSRALPEELQKLAAFEQGLLGKLSFANLPGKLETLNQINSEAGLATLRASHPDLIVSIRYGGILREQVISIPALGVINLHSGLLPDYRGVMATFHAMLNGEAQIGTSLHFITDGSIDTGSIIEQTYLSVDPRNSYLWHVLQLYPDACQSLLKCIAQLNSGGTLQSQPQLKGGVYYSFPQQTDLHAFRKQGLKLYDVEQETALIKQQLGENP